MNVFLMKTLRDALLKEAESPKQKFNLRSWIRGGEQQEEALFAATSRAMDQPDIYPQRSCLVAEINNPEEIFATCGTTACAVGIAMTLDPFKRAGLRCGLSTGVNIYPFTWSEGKFLIAYSAVAKVLDIGERLALQLFDPSHYETDEKENHKAVADRITKAIAAHEAYQSACLLG